MMLVEQRKDLGERENRDSSVGIVTRKQARQSDQF